MFNDRRYLRVDNKPVFFVFSPEQIPDGKYFTSIWNELAIKNGLDGIYFIGIHYKAWDYRGDGFDGNTFHQPSHYITDYSAFNPWKTKFQIITDRISWQLPKRFNFEKLVKFYQLERFKEPDVFPTIIPNWDNTPRSGRSGWVFENTTPEVFKKHLRSAAFSVKNKPHDKQIVIVKSWNEWAEGNYVEPDLQWGKGFLNSIRDVIQEYERF